MQISEIETWTPVLGDENRWASLYEVSSLGRVRSLDRQVPTKGLRMRTIKGRVLKLTVHPSGYLVVGLCLKGKISQRLVHRLVALSFLGPQPSPVHEAAHNDGVRTNCRLSNIAWKTKKENAADKIAHGTNNLGSANGRAGLDEAAVLAIVAAVEAGENQNDVATRFGVPSTTVNHIMTGRTWSALTGRSFKSKHVTMSLELIEDMGRRKVAGDTLKQIAQDLGVGSATVFRNYRRASVFQETPA